MSNDVVQTKKCKHCQTDIPKKAKICPNCRKKQGGIFKWILIIFILFIVIGAMGGSDDSSGKDSLVPKEERVYVSESEIENVYASPDSYKGKYITIKGVVFGEPEVHEDKVYFQMYGDAVNYNKNTVVYFYGTDSILADEYVIVEGKISGSYSYKNVVGGTITALKIETDSVTKSNYMDCCAPTIKEVSLGQTLDQSGYQVTIDKIEFAKEETRLYVTVTNNGSANFSLYPYSIKMVQNQKQYEYQYNFYGNYEELQGDLIPGTSSSGIVVFPAMNPEEPVKIYGDAYCSDWQTQLEQYVFE